MLKIKVKSALPLLMTACGVFSQDMTITGTVQDSALSHPLQGVEVRLLAKGAADTTTGEGKFELFWYDPVTRMSHLSAGYAFSPPALRNNNIVVFTLDEVREVEVATFTAQGRLVHSQREMVQAGVHTVALHVQAAGLFIHRITIGESICLHGGFNPKQRNTGCRAGDVGKQRV